MKKPSAIAVCVGWAGLFALSGCDAGVGGDLHQRLQHEDPSVRIEAMRQAARQKDMSAAPYIVEQLNDGDADVRFFAIMSLEKITGERLGYEYYAPTAERDEAVQRWRRWLRQRTDTDGEGANET